MMSVPARHLPDDIAATLRHLQSELDVVPGFEARVAEGKRRFKLRNRKNDVTFRAVRQTLRAMCSGVQRCMYCEDSCGDQVEHFRPKDHYPGLVFAWENFLYACGACNGPGKGVRFPLFRSSEGSAVLMPGVDAPLPPPHGDALLIDPRTEDPMELMELDLVSTFYFVSRYPEGSRQHQRWRYTADILGLNERDALCRQREQKFKLFKLLIEVVAREVEPARRAVQLARSRDLVSQESHQTVWAEMKRQRERHPTLVELFGAVPEALEW
ncbi:MAG: hypothetical protein Q8S73_09285 [Deltaproteobacteria bacterium]|nr:hypothetical protein [Myxococcales bacterium]MDP3214284.1 hypothetical protein [Deltaproteobacteria bacterium]